MFDKEKLKSIRKYLKEEFDTLKITDRYDSSRTSQTFKINQSNRIYIITVAGEFIEDNDAEAISNILNMYTLKKLFKVEKVRWLVFKGPGKEMGIEF
jgi:hypothetical protein